MGILIGLEHVGHEWPGKHVLSDQTIGVNEGERIGIVGKNGDGKSTLLDIVAKRLEPDEGSVTWRGGIHVGYLGQTDQLGDDETVGHAVVGQTPDYVWASDPRIRGIVDGLFEAIGAAPQIAYETDEDHVVAGLAAHGLECLSLSSAVADRNEYLTRPDKGRRLSVASRQLLDAWMDAHPGSAPDVSVVICDGLSARAVHENAVPFASRFLEEATAAGLSAAPVALVKFGRVAVGDGDNDVAMLKAAGLGIAMGSGSAAAKAAADRIGPDAEPHGIAELCRALWPEAF